MELDEFVHICKSVLPITNFIDRGNLLHQAYVNPPYIAREPAPYVTFGKSSHTVTVHYGLMLLSNNKCFESASEFKVFLVEHKDEILKESQHFSDYRDVEEVVAEALRKAGLLFRDAVKEADSQ